jgi:hypothetical protein
MMNETSKLISQVHQLLLNDYRLTYGKEEPYGIELIDYAKEILHQGLANDLIGNLITEDRLDDPEYLHLIFYSAALYQDI